MCYDKIRNRYVACAYVLIFSLSACGTSPRQIDRLSGPKVVDVMRGNGPNGSGNNNNNHEKEDQLVNRNRGSSSIGHEAYTRTSANEIRQLFPTLPNPTIPLYIHAHPVVEDSTGEVLPVPGYTTIFPLYQRVEYALPSELPASRVSQTDQFPTDASDGKDAPFWDTTQTE
ncbi:TIGR03751 family conjugal transfer lipoprotein [bacterium]|nr:TIGR03751 family conjugal transfer lipoprotein [bacterium]